MNRDDEIVQIFLAETEDLLKIAEESLLRLEVAPEPGPDIDELFRAVHTMKSSMVIVGLDSISEYVHLLENLLSRIRNQQLSITKSLISFLLEDVDFLRDIVDRSVSRGEQDIDPDTFNARKAMVNRFLGLDGIACDPEMSPDKTADFGESEEEHYFHIDLRFRKNIFHTGHDPLLILLNLAEYGEYVEITANIADLPPYEDLVIHEMYLSWSITLKTTASRQEIEDVLMFVKDGDDIEIREITNRFREGIDLKAGETPLGEVLIEKGGLSGEELHNALNKQKKLGEILVEEGKIPDQTLQNLVDQQEESRAVYRKTSIRVDVEKIDYLVNLAEEIGISISRIHNFFPEEGGHLESKTGQELENLRRVNNEFQERVARVRMFPLEGTFRRFHRIARDTAHSQQKRVKIIQSGVDIELDKEVIETITDPLKHMVRNCVDHGIERPAERLAAGKPEEGIIEFRAFRQGGDVFIQIRDDGRGFNVGEIRKRALEMGLAGPEDTFDNNTLMKYVCHPGFSMAAQVTELSGRGVGMDVVKTQVERLGGELRIETEEGKGTIVTLSLPVTFALTEILHVRYLDISYLVPLQGVMGVESYHPERVKNYGSKDRVYFYREEYLPLVNLPVIPEKAEQAESQRGRVVIFLDTGSRQLGLIAEEVLDSYQVVVKSLEANYRNVKGIAGATIMGDGSVALVLDQFRLEEFLL